MRSSVLVILTVLWLSREHRWGVRTPPVGVRGATPGAPPASARRYLYGEVRCRKQSKPLRKMQAKTSPCSSSGAKDLDVEPRRRSSTYAGTDTEGGLLRIRETIQICYTAHDFCNYVWIHRGKEKSFPPGARARSRAWAAREAAGGPSRPAESVCVARFLRARLLVGDTQFPPCLFSAIRVYGSGFF